MTLRLLFVFIVRTGFLIKTTKNEICKNVEIFGQIYHFRICLTRGHVDSGFSLLIKLWRQGSNLKFHNILGRDFTVLTHFCFFYSTLHVHFCTLKHLWLALVFLSSSWQILLDFCLRAWYSEEVKHFLSYSCKFLLRIYCFFNLCIEKYSCFFNMLLT